MGCAFSLAYYEAPGSGGHDTSVRGTLPFLLWNVGPEQNLVVHAVWRLARGYQTIYINDDRVKTAVNNGARTRPRHA